ncbi:hypothetical protein DV096_03575 [Bradymonadaceae bacterium TMQ3]|uniref:Uncharacterized protein n=1 Tax=Lujinxingia sediminis TaxID=2480984 RepID=A0ABY0CX76_9DELT|nr:hypothetical protein [Lujinxingia sediminis]RDV39656.1 hypothetical protein DV096_03575 [Bradymonadaceae bacterium TMQ3]RVU48299.1 hypothetical protein EA187_02355 [Lujinxingia sediminis]TXC77599.1 hypothetical protein FRC91_02360 [Bradymonadales bacterium TMQ1]
MTHLLRTLALAILTLTLTLAAPAALALTGAQIEEASSAFAHEPTVADTHQAALRHLEMGAPDLDHWTRRARLSALLPQVQGQVAWLDQHDLQNRFRENIEADENGDYQRDYAQHYLYDDTRSRTLYSLRLSLDLSQLVYTPQEMVIQREVRARWKHRDDLLRIVTDTYFTRRRHQLYDMLLMPDSEEEALARHLEVQALTARLDALTGGWFSEQLRSAQGGDR